MPRFMLNILKPLIISAFACSLVLSVLAVPAGAASPSDLSDTFGVPYTINPAPSLPAMPPLPELPALVPLAVQEGLATQAALDAKNATSTTSTSVLGSDELLKDPTDTINTDDVNADDTDTIDIPSDPSDPTTTSTPKTASLLDEVKADSDSSTPKSTSDDVSVEEEMFDAAEFAAAMQSRGLPSFTTSGQLNTDPLPGVEALSSLSDRYTTLGGTLTAFYADRAGMPLASFVQSNSKELAPVVGKELSPANSASMATLQADLASSGANPLFKAASVNDYKNLMSAASSTADSKVGLSTLAWADKMSSFRGTSSSLGPEALAFSGVLSQSLSAMIGSYPDVFSSVRASGVGSPAASAAWRSSMLSAGAASSKSLASLMPSPCYSTMMTAMVSGSPTAAGKAGGAGCGTCLSTGLYLNKQMSSLFDPSAKSTIPNMSDSILPPADWNAMPAWQKNTVLAQNPSLTNKASSSPTSLSGCSSTSAQSAKALQVTLPGVFSSLNKGR